MQSNTMQSKMQPIVMQPLGLQTKPKRSGAAIAAIVIQLGLVYLLAMGLGVAPKPIPELRTVMINVPTEMSEPPPAPPVEKVNPDMLEVEVPLVPEPDIVVDQPIESPIEAMTTDVPADPAPAISDSVSQQVKVLQNSEPPYPNASILRQEEGTVMVRITVGTNGRVMDARVEKSSGFSALDEAALKAIRTWRFAAAKRGGQSVEASVVVPVVFELRNRGK